VARRSSKIVLDTSVVIKWFTKEEGSSSATRILDSFANGSLQVAVSALTFYEAANALRYKRDFSSEDVQRCISYLLEMELDVRGLDVGLLVESLRIAFDGNVTFYDAVPAAIAKLEGVQCITADEKSQFTPLSRRHYPIKLLEADPSAKTPRAHV